MRGVRTALMMTAVLVVGPGGVATGGGASGVATEFSDTVDVVKDQAVSNAEIAVRLTEATPSTTGATRTVVARDDVFADSMTSGVLQDDSPLLLVPSSGPLPARVRDALAQIGSTEVVLLGGTAAITPEVEAQLADLGLSTQRRAGADRIATAVEIARAEAPTATTAILTRAFGTSQTDPSQAFADSLAVGGWSADTGWPVLLSDSTALSTATAEYLAGSAVTRVEIVGGTAAIGAGVEQALRDMGMQVERTAGTNRFDTAVEIADKRGASSAADVGRVTLVEGQAPDAWAGGFAAAAHSAAFDAPILLTNGDAMPPETAAFLGTGSTFAGTQPPVRLTCVTRTSRVCHEGRDLLGLPSAGVAIAPGGGPIEPGTPVRIDVTATQTVTPSVAGTCIDGVVSLSPSSSASEEVTTTRGHPCTVEVTIRFVDGTVQRTVASYDESVLPPASEGVGALQATVVSSTTGAAVPGATVAVAGLTSATTDDGGLATLDLPAGQHVVRVSAVGYADLSSSPLTIEEGVTTPATFALSPTIVGEGVRIVLSWGEQPTDLDSHLWLPTATPFEIAYYQPGSLTACPFAALDVDDTSSFGPETITATQAFAGVYRYAVHNFSGSPDLGVSGAVVELYDDTGLRQRFTVPTDGAAGAVWWHVFDIDVAAGTITPGQGIVADYPGPYGAGSAEGCTG